MNIYPSFKYQFLSQKTTVVTYYGVLLGMIVLFGSINLISFGIHAGDSSVSVGIGAINGLSSITAVMAFAVGWAAFRENFSMALQNGVSRKSLFLGRLCATGAFCFVLAVCDELVTLLFGILGKILVVRTESVSLFQLFYGGAQNWLLDALWAVAFSFFLLLAASALGYLTVTLLYRLPLWARVAAISGTIIAVNLAIPLLKMMRDRFHLEALWGALCRGAAWFFDLVFNSPANTMAFCFALFCVCSGLAWLAIRRLPLK